MLGSRGLASKYEQSRYLGEAPVRVKKEGHGSEETTGRDLGSTERSRCFRGAHVRLWGEGCESKKRVLGILGAS